MNISATQNVKLAIQAVGEHRFRSLLTVLGIVIGITTVVTVASLLTGLRAGVVTFFQELGPDNIFVYKTSRRPQPGAAEGTQAPADAAGVRRGHTALVQFGGRCRPAALHSPGGRRQADHGACAGFRIGEHQRGGAVAKHGRYCAARFRDGPIFHAEEDQRGAHVAIIGSNVADSLYPGGTALGSTMMMDGAEYNIIGVYAKAKGGFFGENGQDNTIIIPLRTAESRYPQVDRFMITAKAKTGKREEAFAEVQGIMRRIRRLATGAKDDFSISTPDQIIQQFDRITSLIGLVAIAISALGLLVGGIGVMNIMLVSVTERTREIGVRKALGARRRDIIGQFLVEAMTLTGAGGVLGIVIAVLITMLVGALVPSLPSQVPSWALITGFSVSVIIGVFFGVWPAVKAAQLDPVEALRYE